MVENKSGITPSLNRMVVRKHDIKPKSGKIILTEEAQISINAPQGEIVAVGPTSEGYSVGDKVIWGRYAGVLSQRPNGDFWCMNDDDVIGTIDEYYEGQQNGK